MCHTQDYGAIRVRSVIYPQVFLFWKSYPQISEFVTKVVRPLLWYIQTDTAFATKKGEIMQVFLSG